MKTESPTIERTFTHVRAGSSPAQRIASIICLLGCFLYMALSEALLNAHGGHYTDGRGGTFQKIHPGSILIFASFLILLCDGLKPWRNFMNMCKNFSAYLLLLTVTILAFIYTVWRSGVHQLGFLIDTHMIIPLIALVLANAPRAYLRNAALLFVGFAALDAIVGIFEYISHRRFYSFDPAWPVLHEVHFRASSFMGSPVASALFLPVALFTALSLDLTKKIKMGLAVLFPLALVAFGAYVALAITLVGLVIVGIARIRDISTKHGRVLCFGVFLAGCLCFAAPLLGSANNRAVAVAEAQTLNESQRRAFELPSLLTAREMVFGISMDRVKDLAMQVGISIPSSDIDNPWILMLLILGGAGFILWLAATTIFFKILLRKQPVTIIFAAIAYFGIASTCDSFGRKDTIYPATVGLIACVTTSRRLQIAQKRALALAFVPQERVKWL